MCYYFLFFKLTVTSLSSQTLPYYALHQVHTCLAPTTHKTTFCSKRNYCFLLHHDHLQRVFVPFQHPPFLRPRIKLHQFCFREKAGVQLRRQLGLIQILTNHHELRAWALPHRLQQTS